MLTDFGQVFIFMIIAVIYVAVAIIFAKLIGPGKPSPSKNSTYECGEEAMGETWVKFNIRYYVVALIFIIFDVEIIFLFPWAVVFDKIGIFAYIEMVIFLFILVLGFIYALVKGDLKWDKPMPIIPKLDRQIFKATK